MNPILYKSTETQFDTNGLGTLSDAVRCVVTEERNGLFELELDYPITGLHYAEIALRCLILAKPNPVDDAQPFRVYRITRPMNGVVTVYAQHLSYDLAGIPAQPFTAPNAPAAMAALKANAVTPCPFTFWTDKTTAAAMTNAVPASIRSLLGGVRGSVLDVYGGEYAFDRYTVRLYGARGANRGVSIRYGKNLTSLEQDESCAAVYTGVYPYWTNSDGALAALPEKIVSAPGTYDFTRILPLDLSAEWQERPTDAQLRARAARYIEENAVGVPKVSLTLSFAQLEQTEEYKGLALLERVSLCDTVNVEFPALGVSATAKAVRTVYDALRGRFDSIDLGDARTTLADTIAGQGQQIADAQRETKTFLQQAVDSATQQITGNRGGYVVLHSSTGGGTPDEILIMDRPDIAQAVKVWRWNKSGLGYSPTGYNGPYGLAITQDGSIVANYITGGTLDAALANVVNLNASNITAGTLNAKWIDVINLTAESIVSGILASIDGNTQFNLNDSYIDLKGMGKDGKWPVHMRLAKGALHAYSALGGTEQEAVRIVSSNENNGGNVHVYTNGKHAVELSGKAYGGRIMVGDPNERVRINMGCNASNGRTYLTLYNSAGQIMWQVYENESGNAVVYQKTS